MVEVEICIKHCVGIEANTGGRVDQGDGYVAPVVAGFAGAVGGTDVEVGIGKCRLVEAFAEAEEGVGSGNVNGKWSWAGARNRQCCHACMQQFEGDGRVPAWR